MGTISSRNSVRDNGCRRYFWFQKFWSVSGLTLFAVTWKLWTPQSVFPQVPFFEFLANAPATVDWTALLLAIAGLVTVLLTKGPFQIRIGLALFAISAITLVLLDQNRLQPWAYQFVISALVMSLSRGRVAIWLLRLIAISIYIYSAASKFDFQFMETLGREFLGTMASLVRIDTTDLDSGLVSRLVLLLPTYELVMGFGLLLRTTRRYAVWGIVVMHAMLILILGPLGLNHQPGVLVWNAFLLGEVIFLFGGNKTSAERTKFRNRGRGGGKGGWIGDSLAGGLTLLVLLFPLSVSYGVCDHWPGWEVYAPRSSRAALEISEREVARLPNSLQKYLSRDPQLPGFRQLELDQWVLEALHVPIYPSNRFQFAVAVGVIKEYGLTEFRISTGGISDRWTGERDWRVTDKLDEIEMSASQFRFGTEVRERLLTNVGH